MSDAPISKRSKKSVGLKLDRNLLARLDAHLAARQPGPNRTQVVEDAITRWLNAQEEKERRMAEAFALARKQEKAAVPELIYTKEGSQE